jgi:hypothetical protein
MHIISNRMNFNADGLNVGFHEPVMHVFNKNEFTGLIALDAEERGNDVDDADPEAAHPNDSKLHRELVRQRQNIVLLGDSLGDRKMAHGVPHSNLLTVGFMNRYRPENGAWIEVGREQEDRSMTPNEWATTQSERDKVAQEYMHTFDVVVWGDQGFDHLVVPLLAALVQN